MTYKHITGFLFFGYLILSPGLHAQQVETIPENWQATIELHPLNDGYNSDVINLVPKQSIMMKAFVWYPDTQTWVVKYPDWDMPGASIEKFNTTVANLERTHDGLQQYGHTQNYIITPVDIGILALTQKSIDVSATKNGSEMLPLSSEVQLNVRLPDGVYSIDDFFPAYGVNVQQTFYHYTNAEGARQISIAEVEKINLIKGEMLERRITLKADGIKGSSIPALTSRVKQQNVQAQSHFDDVVGIFGFEGGKRIDSFFYTAEQGGTITLEPFAIQWWHIGEKKHNNIHIAGVSFDSEKVDAYEESISLTWWEKYSASIFSCIVVILMVLTLCYISYISFKAAIKHTYTAAMNTLHAILKSEQLLYFKMILALLFGSKNKFKTYFLSWYYHLKLKTIPNDIADYLYVECQPENHEKISGSWRILLSCYQMRKQLQRKRMKINKYQLPEL